MSTSFHYITIKTINQVRSTEGYTDSLMELRGAMRQAEDKKRLVLLCDPVDLKMGWLHGEWGG